MPESNKILTQSSAELPAPAMDDKCVVCGSQAVMDLYYEGQHSATCLKHLAEAEKLMRVSRDFFGGRSF